MFLDLFVFADHLWGGVNILDMFTGRIDYKKIILVGFPPPIHSTKILVPL